MELMQRVLDISGKITPSMYKTGISGRKAKAGAL